MTQLPGPQTVQGAFDGVERRFGGLSWTPVLEDDSEGRRHAFRFPDRVAYVALVVGSHVYQQYFERIERGLERNYRRLPFLWHIEEEKWMPLERVFLHPEGGGIDDYAAYWNENCIFCHNTRPRPGMDQDLRSDAKVRHYESHVSELGISCEACHGEGAEHVARHANPLARMVSGFTASQDPTIVHPERLDQEREVAVCGQCHAQRLPADREAVIDYLTQGPSFRPGDRLAEHVEPIVAETSGIDPHDSRPFRPRFWKDGTPRLTAYEYQAVTSSPCFEAGALRCGSCHRMHAADDGQVVDARGQVEPSLVAGQGDGVCIQCHDEFGQAVAEHTGHASESAGSRCLACHMPRIVYGLLDVRRSHRIESPDPQRDIEAGRPHACTLCHLDRDGAWVATEMTRIFGREFGPPRSRPDKAPLDMPDALASLLSGDVLQRAVAAKHFGSADAAVTARGKAFLLAGLIATLGDGYPAIRHLTQRSLRRLSDELALGWEARLTEEALFGSAEARRALIDGLFSDLERKKDAFDDPPPNTMIDDELRVDLRGLAHMLNLQDSNVISIGE